MRLHEREKLVREAGADLKSALIEWSRKFGERLTFAEEIKIVSGELGDWLGSMAKYAIRAERHGDTSKPGGLACLAIFLLVLVGTGCDVHFHTTPPATVAPAQSAPPLCYSGGYVYRCPPPRAYRPRPARPAHVHGPACSHGQRPHVAPSRPASKRPSQGGPTSKPAQRGPQPRSRVRAVPAPSRKGRRK